MAGITLEGVPRRKASISDEEARGFLARITNWAVGRVELRRSRITLRELSDAQLRDIGLTREQAKLEGNLPWWR